MYFPGRLRYLAQQWIHVYGRLWSTFSFFYVEVNSNSEAFFLHSVDWRSVHSRVFQLQFLQRGFERRNLDIISPSAPFLAVCGGLCCSVQLEPSMMKSSSVRNNNNNDTSRFPQAFPVLSDL